MFVVGLTIALPVLLLLLFIQPTLGYEFKRLSLVCNWYEHVEKCRSKDLRPAIVDLARDQEKLIELLRTNPNKNFWIAGQYLSDGDKEMFRRPTKLQLIERTDRKGRVQYGVEIVKVLDHTGSNDGQPLCIEKNLKRQSKQKEVVSLARKKHNKNTGKEVAFSLQKRQGHKNEHDASTRSSSSHGLDFKQFVTIDLGPREEGHKSKHDKSTKTSSSHILDHKKFVTIDLGPRDSTETSLGHSTSTTTTTTGSKSMEGSVVIELSESEEEDEQNQGTKPDGNSSIGSNVQIDMSSSSSEQKEAHKDPAVTTSVEGNEETKGIVQKIKEAVKETYDEFKKNLESSSTTTTSSSSSDSEEDDDEQHPDIPNLDQTSDAKQEHSHSVSGTDLSFNYQPFKINEGASRMPEADRTEPTMEKQKVNAEPSNPFKRKKFDLFKMYPISNDKNKDVVTTTTTTTTQPQPKANLEYLERTLSGTDAPPDYGAGSRDSSEDEPVSNLIKHVSGSSWGDKPVQAEESDLSNPKSSPGMSFSSSGSSSGPAIQRDTSVRVPGDDLCSEAKKTKSKINENDEDEVDIVHEISDSKASNQDDKRVAPAQWSEDDTNTSSDDSKAEKGSLSQTGSNEASEEHEGHSDDAEDKKPNPTKSVPDKESEDNDDSYDSDSPFEQSPSMKVLDPRPAPPDPTGQTDDDVHLIKLNSEQKRKVADLKKKEEPGFFTKSINKIKSKFTSDKDPKEKKD